MLKSWRLPKALPQQFHLDLCGIDLHPAPANHQVLVQIQYEEHLVREALEVALLAKRTANEMTKAR